MCGAPTRPHSPVLDCRIIDLGLACLLESKSRVSTKAGAVGTPLYMSPEKGNGMSYDGKDDVWALGCMLVGAILGKPLEDMVENKVGIFANNRPAIDDLLKKCRAKDAHGANGLRDCRGISDTAARHAAMLSAANISFVVADSTNIQSDSEFGDAIQLRPFEVLAEEWHALRLRGPPQAAGRALLVWALLEALLVRALLSTPDFNTSFEAYFSSLNPTHNTSNSESVTTSS